jgi:hypothetical protein
LLAAVSGAGGLLSNAIDMVRAQPVDPLLENLTRYFLKARWLQMLLADGRNPDTNATIIPPAVLDTLATGFSVWVGNLCVLCILFLLPLFTQQECTLHVVIQDSSRMRRSSPPLIAEVSHRWRIVGIVYAFSFRPLGYVYSTLAGYSDA